MAWLLVEAVLVVLASTPSGEAAPGGEISNSHKSSVVRETELVSSASWENSDDHSTVDTHNASNSPGVSNAESVDANYISHLGHHSNKCVEVYKVRNDLSANSVHSGVASHRTDNEDRSSRTAKAN